MMKNLNLKNLYNTFVNFLVVFRMRRYSKFLVISLDVIIKVSRVFNLSFRHNYYKISDYRVQLGINRPFRVLLYWLSLLTGNIYRHLLVFVVSMTRNINSLHSHTMFYRKQKWSINRQMKRRLRIFIKCTECLFYVTNNYFINLRRISIIQSIIQYFTLDLIELYFPWVPV